MILFWVRSFCSAFETVPLLCLPVTCRLLRFHWLRSCFKLQIFTSGLDMLNFAHGVTSAFGSFFEKMTLFGKLQADQVETTTCRDLRLSKSSWEHLGTVVARSVAGIICLMPLAPRFDCLQLKTRADHHFCVTKEAASVTECSMN